MQKIGILNTTIIDGTKKAAYRGHILIRGERIEKIYPIDDTSLLEQQDGVRTIDGSQYVLTPGFIDTHSHCDLEILVKRVLEPKVRQGITTEILGHDGIAMAPLPLQYIEDWRKNIAALVGESDEIDWTYTTVAGYLEAIANAKPTSNSAYLIPHGNVRMAAMGFVSEHPTNEQMEQMKAIVREAMELGYVGLSSGLIYFPCAYAHEIELIELCKIVAKYHGTFVVHQRSEANTILESMDEIIRIGMASGVHIHFSHFKICGKNNWHMLDSVLGKLDEARAKGLRVSFDQYPYTAGSTMLGVILPPWAHVGGTNKMLERLQDPKCRELLKADLNEKNARWDNFIEFAGTSGICITSVKTEKNQNVIGKNLDELGKMRGKDPLEAAFDLIVEENNHVGMINFYGDEEHIKQFVCRDEMNVCTDGLLGGKPHPRTYGSFPRIISEYVTKEKVLSLEEAIYKMTYRPASLFGLIDRGVIKEGAYADLLLFDAKEFKDIGTYLEPDQFPAGLRMVMVNGHILFDGENYNIKPIGKILKRDNY